MVPWRGYRLFLFLLVWRASSCLSLLTNKKKLSLHSVQHRLNTATPSLFHRLWDRTSSSSCHGSVSTTTSNDDESANHHQSDTSKKHRQQFFRLFVGTQQQRQQQQQQQHHLHVLYRWCNANFFLVGMVVAITAARLAPTLASCNGGLPERLISQYGVTMIFLLSGLSLQLQQLSQAVGNVKLNACIQGTTFVVWPLAVIALVRVYTWLGTIHEGMATLVPRPLLDGFVILSCLPTTVNMCVILTTAAGGNVATALTNAVLSNLAGIVVTPALLYRYFQSSAQQLLLLPTTTTMTTSHTMTVLQVVPFRDMMVKLSQKVALPLLVGQLLRLTPLLNVTKQHAAFCKRAQEVILLSILWSAFCAALVSPMGLDQLSVTGWLAFAALVPLLHTAALAGSFLLFRQLGFRPDTVVAAMFGASHKTLAFGLPLIHTIFSGNAQLASYCAPILLLHPVQLILGSLLLPRLQRYTSQDTGSAR